MSNRRLRPRIVFRALLGLVAMSTLVVGPQAGAQEDTGAGLGGFQGTAGAYGMKGFYFPEGSGLPLGEFVDVGVPDAFATIATGPATFARASVADPGDLVANPNALIGAADPNAPRTPEYPYRISAGSTSGEPEDRVTPAPGLESSVEATDRGSIAMSSAGATEAPALVTTGPITTTADTSTDGSTVSVHSRTEISSIEVLDVLTFESVVIDVTATSDGETTTVEGGTTVGDAFVLETPVVVDSDGVHPEEGEEEPTVPVVGDVVDSLLGGGGGDGEEEQTGVLSTLEEAGLTVSVAKPRKHEVDGAAGLAATGLRIDFAFSDETVPLLSDLFDALPPLENPVPDAPGVEDAIALIEANNMFAVEFGGAYVDLGARPGFEFEPSTPSIASSPVSTPSMNTGTSSSPSNPPSTGSSAPTSQAAAPAPSSTPATPASSSPASLSAGIGAMALAALILQPLIGDRIARAAGAILGADQPDFCPREGQ